MHLACHRSVPRASGYVQWTLNITVRPGLAFGARNREWSRTATPWLCGRGASSGASLCLYYLTCKMDILIMTLWGWNGRKQIKGLAKCCWGSENMAQSAAAWHAEYSELKSQVSLTFSYSPVSHLSFPHKVHRGASAEGPPSTWRPDPPKGSITAFYPLWHIINQRRASTSQKRPKVKIAPRTQTHLLCPRPLSVLQTWSSPPEIVPLPVELSTPSSSPSLWRWSSFILFGTPMCLHDDELDAFSITLSVVTLFYRYKWSEGWKFPSPLQCLEHSKPSKIPAICEFIHQIATEYQWVRCHSSHWG